MKKIMNAETRPFSWVNDPRVISQNDNVVSVNSALGVDLTGQVCAESIGQSQYSGTGGQADYVRGARWSRGGKSFIAMIRPITLFPFPKKAIDGLDYGRVKGIIDLEMAIPAQMRDDIELQVCRRCPVYEYGRSGGVLLDDETTKAAVLEIIKGGEQ